MGASQVERYEEALEDHFTAIGQDEARRFLQRSPWRPVRGALGNDRIPSFYLSTEAGLRTRRRTQLFTA